MKPRVTHVITGLATGGAEMMLLKLVQNPESTFEHTVVSLGGLGTLGEHMQRAGRTVIPLNLMPGKLPLLGVRRLLREVRRSDPHVVQGWMYHGNLAATFAQPFARRSAALSWSIRCSFNELGSERWLTRSVINAGARLSRRPSAIIYNSIRARRQHAENGYADCSGLVIPNGFDVRRFQPSWTQRLALREKWRLPPDALVVGLLARVHPMKDHATFLRAASEVLQSAPTTMFVVAGRGAPSLRTLMPELAEGLGPNLMLLPEVSDIPTFMNGLDVFVLSSAWGEAFPNVLGEAMSCGVPCIATDVGDCAEIIGDAACIAPPQQQHKLAHAIARVVAAPLDLRRSWGEKGRARVLANYTIERVSGLYEDVWQRLATGTDLATIARSAR